MLKYQLFILFACFAALNAGLIRQSNSACPEIQSKQDFDYHPYAGVWYEIQRFRNTFELGMSCVRATYGEIEPGLLSVHNTAILRDGTATDINGTATAPFAEEPGHLLVEFYPGTPPGNYWVLDTDYTSYSAVYDCESFAGISIEFAWIMARENALTPELYEKAAAAFTKFGIKLDKFIDTFQGDTCVYTP